MLERASEHQQLTRPPTQCLNVLLGGTAIEPQNFRTKLPASIISKTQNGKKQEGVTDSMFVIERNTNDSGPVAVSNGNAS